MPQNDGLGQKWLCSAALNMAKKTFFDFKISEVFLGKARDRTKHAVKVKHKNKAALRREVFQSSSHPREGTEKRTVALQLCPDA